MNSIFKRAFSKYNNLCAELSMRSGMDLNKPNYFCAKITMKCNSRCVHCDIWKTKFAENELNTEQWLVALDNLRSWLGRFRMVFTGGEALLRLDMLRILEHAATLGIEVELLTNGIIVSDSLAEKIVSTGISQVTLSFDGLNPDTHDRFRGEEGFHGRTSLAIAALRHHREKLGKPLRILLKTVVSRNNLDELAELAIFSQANVLEIQYQPIEQNYGDKPDPYWYKKSTLWIHDLSLLKSEIDRLKQLKSEGAPIANSIQGLDMIVNYFEKPEKLMDSVQSHDTKTPRQYCRHAVTNFVISSNGDVRMCFKMDPIGNITMQSPEEIWAKRPRCWSNKSLCAW